MQNPLLSQWYLQKINKALLPLNPQGAQQMHRIEVKAEEGCLDSPPGLQKSSLVAERQVSEQVHRGHRLACWSSSGTQG